MDYSFNGEIAAMYGVDEAVFIHNLYWWIRKNEANGRHYYDGRNWTYNSMRAFSELFPFWTQRQLRRIIRNLSDNGVIYIGNYNAAGFDRTQWYALDETVYSIYSNGLTHLTETSNPFDQTVTPIPDSKPYIKPYIKPDSKSDPDILQGFSPEIQDALQRWLQYKAERRETYKPTGLKALVSEIKNKLKIHPEASVIELINTCMANGWRGIIWDKLEGGQKQNGNTGKSATPRSTYQGAKRL